jgi:hypothetical protein
LHGPALSGIQEFFVYTHQETNTPKNQSFVTPSNAENTKKQRLARPHLCPKRSALVQASK